jgi:NAD(P)-dependent dehydrogenase (short-subunit alcohol dehydrogenase family)
MSLFRAKPSDGVAWITGGSTGIGRALALELVTRGWRVAVSARNIQPFDEVLGSVGSSTSAVKTYPCDVTDADAMRKIAEKIQVEMGPIVLAVFNAGNYIPIDGFALDTETFKKTFAVNFHGVINGLVPVVEQMKLTGKGQVAITGSVTSYGGLPTAAAYGASKAALNSMAQSLKFDFDRMNIRLQMVNPGFVDSELTKKNEFAMPGLLATEDAAKRLANGLERGGFEIRFPRRLAWPLRLISMLPNTAYFWLIAKATKADKPLK